MTASSSATDTATLNLNNKLPPAYKSQDEPLSSLIERRATTAEVNWGDTRIERIREECLASLREAMESGLIPRDKTFKPLQVASISLLDLMDSAIIEEFKKSVLAEDGIEAVRKGWYLKSRHLAELKWRDSEALQIFKELENMLKVNYRTKISGAVQSARTKTGVIVDYQHPHTREPDVRWVGHTVSRELNIVATRSLDESCCHIL